MVMCSKTRSLNEKHSRQANFIDCWVHAYCAGRPKFSNIFLTWWSWYWCVIISTGRSLFQWTKICQVYAGQTHIQMHVYNNKVNLEGHLFQLSVARLWNMSLDTDAALCWSVFSQPQIAIRAQRQKQMETANRKSSKLSSRFLAWNNATTVALFPFLTHQKIATNRR